MVNYFNEAVDVMKELYGKDTVMSLATVNGDKPNVRAVNVYYCENVFYITTYALTNKVKEISRNSSVALNNKLFVAHGKAENIGNPLDEKNAQIREKLRKAFVAFYDKHVNEKDKNTCILKINLDDALVFAHDYKYIIDYKNKTASREKYVVDIVY